MQNDHSPPLYERVLAELRRGPGQKANELADALGVDRRDINRCLNSELDGRVRQESDYRWHLVDLVSSNQPAHHVAPASELARLSRYYLECIGQDMDEGVSAFATSRHGDPDYATLSCLPQVARDQAWFNQPGVARILGKVRQDRGKLTAWLGYPVRLRYHRTARWEGYFVEPVLLWRIELGAEGDDYPRIDDGAPVPNAKFLRSVAMGDGLQLADETARLVEELGLNVPIGDLPDSDDVIQRLQRIRPDWDWQESLDATDCRGVTSLAELSRAGIYNRAVIVPSERSPYTQGLETELKALAEMPETRLHGTALGHWMNGGVEAGVAQPNDQPLVEVLPMNSEQRAAVRAALSSPHTVITGPPGTGKSQVVTNLLVNAAWRGMKVLFASKNNKAVDVVEGRVNGLGARPVLLRLGAREYEAKLATYLTQLLAGNPGAEERVAYEESLERHRLLTARLEDLDRIQQQTLDARNTVDQLDSEADEARLLLAGSLASVDEAVVRQAEADLVAFVRTIDEADRGRQGWFTRLVWPWVAPGRVRALEHLIAIIAPRASSLGVVLPGTLDEHCLPTCREVAEDGRRRLAAAKQELAYRQALDVLQRSPSFEQIAVQRADLANELAQNSQRLWRDWVQLAPSRLSPEQRKAVADYAAVLQVMTAPDAQRVHTSTRKRAKELQSEVTELFSCWAVTSLSARGRVPFEPGYFDFVVIDEASQCDIASALPLLFRAKRSVVIGDPQQLRHISALTRPRDSELQYKYGLVDTRVGWMYSVASLYDVAAGVVSPASIVNLRDHHRSHADIIEFSNRAFYEGRLRTATRYRTLKRPRSNEPGIVWHDIQGQVLRPNSGGAQNVQEAKALVADLEDLLKRRRYEGTVGVVTPFRAQAQLLQQLVEASEALRPCRERAELLVDTVHRFQGDERDVMFFSPVVSSGMAVGALGFLRANGNLFNVAITRARGLLHVVGDQQAAVDSGIEYLASFANYVAGLSSAAPSAAGQNAAAQGAEYPRVAKPEVVSEWERILYRALYEAGVRPIPQYSIEQYDLDFAVIVGERRLDIEVDGERYHRSWTGELCLRDQLRNQRLIELGWEVKRFWVYEVRDKLPECVATVAQWVGEASRTQSAC